MSKLMLVNQLLLYPINKPYSLSSTAFLKGQSVALLHLESSGMLVKMKNPGFILDPLNRISGTWAQESVILPSTPDESFENSVFKGIDK